MNKNRPVNLDISSMKLPITAYVSISHRISGVIMLAGILVLLWMLDQSLRSEERFDALKNTLDHPVCTFIIWATLSALLWHLVMGVRHLIMDLGVGESLQGGRRGAFIAIVVSVIGVLAIAGWLLW